MSVDNLPVENLSEFIELLRRSDASLEGRSDAELEALAKSYVLDQAKSELSQRLWLSAVDPFVELDKFCQSLADLSAATRKQYRWAVGKFLAWAKKETLEPLILLPTQADRFVASLEEGFAPTSVNGVISGVSAWFTWLERSYPVQNPFLGTRARPGRVPVKQAIYPTEAEREVILKNLPPFEAAVVAVMSGRGLRVGALPSLKIRGGAFSATSKGREISGAMPQRIIEYIKAAGLKLSQPFEGTTAGSLGSRLKYLLRNLYEDNLIDHPYSAHDFRHFFAAVEYRQHRDIGQLRELLGHSSVSTTEMYLRGQLGFDTEDR